MEPDRMLLLHAVDAVQSATSLDDALVALVTTLQPRLELWHANLATHRTGSPHVQILASWSLAESVLDAGVEISANISPSIEAALETLREGQVVTSVVGADSSSLVDQLLSEQGVASALALPLHCDDRALLLLALGSSSGEAFQTATPGFFEGIAAGITARIQKLASTPTN